MIHIKNTFDASNRNHFDFTKAFWCHKDCFFEEFPFDFITILFEDSKNFNI